MNSKDVIKIIEDMCIVKPQSFGYGSELGISLSLKSYPKFKRAYGHPDLTILEKYSSVNYHEEIRETKWYADFLISCFEKFQADMIVEMKEEVYSE